MQGMTIRTARLPGAGNLVRQVKISVACPTGQVIIICFYWLYYISVQALDFESLWQFLFCGSTIATSVSFYVIKLTDFSVLACDWLALFTRGEAWLALSFGVSFLKGASEDGRGGGGGGNKNKNKFEKLKANR